MSNEFGKLMRRYRRTADKTFLDVANALDFSLSYVADVESGRRAPFSDDKLALLSGVIDAPLMKLKQAAALCRSSYTISVGEGASPQAHEVGAALARGFGSLNEEQLTAIQRALKKK